MVLKSLRKNTNQNSVMLSCFKGEKLTLWWQNNCLNVIACQSHCKVIQSMLLLVPNLINRTVKGKHSFEIDIDSNKLMWQRNVDEGVCHDFVIGSLKLFIILSTILSIINIYPVWIHYLTRCYFYTKHVGVNSAENSFVFC